MIRMSGRVFGLPAQGAGLVLGKLPGPAYAAWCTSRMANDARAAFGGV